MAILDFKITNYGVMSGNVHSGLLERRGGSGNFRFLNYELRSNTGECTLKFI